MVLTFILSSKSATSKHLSLVECKNSVRSCLDTPDNPNDKQLWLYVSSDTRCYIKTHTIGVNEDEVRANLLNDCVDPQIVGYGIFEGRIYDEFEKIQQTNPSLRVVRCVDYGLISNCAVHSLKPNGWRELTGENMTRFCNIVQVANDRTITYIITQQEAHKSPFDDMRYNMTPGAKASVLSNLCSMFTILHANSCYHCDLHARNFLCDLSGNVTLFDFDLACCHAKSLESDVWYGFEYDMKMIERYASKNGIILTDEMLSRCYDMFCIFIASELAKSSQWADVGRRFLGIDDMHERFKIAKARTRRLKKGTSPFTQMAIQSLLVFSDCTWKLEQT
jgi:hypothetical protein